MRILLLAVIALVALAQGAKSLAGDWRLYPRTGDEAEGAGPGFLLTFTVDGGRVTGKARGPQGDWPVSDVRYDGQKLTFKIHNGEEYLAAYLKRAGEQFEGSYEAETGGVTGRLSMKRNPGQ